jgi:hypothetical protein
MKTMDYEKILSNSHDANVGSAVLNALKRLFNQDKQLLKLDSSEQSITAKIAQYLEPYFKGMDIDVEYNRMGDAPKSVTWDETPANVYPDIIVHLRNTDTNILAIELKKNSNSETKDKDIRKLRAYRTELDYKHTLFIRLCVNGEAGNISECEWVL